MGTRADASDISRQAGIDRSGAYRRPVCSEHAGSHRHPHIAACDRRRDDVQFPRRLERVPWSPWPSREPHAKKFAAAQTKFEQAIRDNPNFAEAHNNLGFTLRQQGPQNYSKALEHYSKAIQLKPSMAETYEYRGVLFAKMGRKAAAEKDLATLKKLNSKLAGELEEFLKTGKEEDEYGPTSPKQKS
jgi:tetratricopeptide (TPR) repeat protein